MKIEKDKLFFSIKEVSNKLHVSESLLRYWEKEFPSMNPDRTVKGFRRYRQKDIDEIRLIHFLIKENGMTIVGARKKLEENRNKIVSIEKIVNCLKDVRTELVNLKLEFEELDKFQNQSC